MTSRGAQFRQAAISKSFRAPAGKKYFAAQGLELFPAKAKDSIFRDRETRLRLRT
jgi:hypothetical protein